ATDPSSFRGPLRQVEEHAKANPKVKASLELKPEQKAALREPFNLDAADLEEVEDTTFRPLDAYHLFSCFLLREAAKPIEVQGLPQRQQAAAALAWVMRQVMLQENDAALLPPHLVLGRGYGSARERALVFLSLLQQIPRTKFARQPDGKEPQFGIDGY